MVGFIRNVIGSLGYAGIAPLMFVENVFPPIPSEIIIPLAGVASRIGSTPHPG